MKRIRWLFFSLLLCFQVKPMHAHSDFLKTIRFEHGIPIVLRSGDSFLVIEFELQTPSEVHWDSGEAFLVKAPYRFLLSQKTDQGLPSIQEGVMMEHYRYDLITDADGKTSRRLYNIDSKEQLSAGPFSLQWSNAGAGHASWVYLKNQPPIELVLTLDDMDFEAIHRDVLESLVNEVNVFSIQRASGVSFALNRLTSRSVTAKDGPKIVGMEQKGSDVVLHLEGLIPGERYAFERSSSMGKGQWKGAGAFVAETVESSFSPAHEGNQPLEFFRIGVAVKEE